MTPSANRPPVRPGRRKPGRRGVAVVEFAILAPILVFLTVGMLEIARGLMVKEVLTDAARRGCRTAILPLSSNSTVQADVNAVLADNGISSSDVTVKVYVNDKEADASTAKQNDKIGVQVVVPSSKVCWVTPIFLASRNVESRTLVMLRQR